MKETTGEVWVKNEMIWHIYRTTWLCMCTNLNISHFSIDCCLSGAGAHIAPGLGMCDCSEDPSRQARQCLEPCSALFFSISYGFTGGGLVLSFSVWKFSLMRGRKCNHMRWKYHTFICIKHIVSVLLTFLWGNTFKIKMSKRFLGCGTIKI